MQLHYKIYINSLSGERIIKSNHARAFIYFYEKADREHKPEGKDIIELKTGYDTKKI